SVFLECKRHGSPTRFLFSRAHPVFFLFIHDNIKVIDGKKSFFQNDETHVPWTRRKTWTDPTTILRIRETPADRHAPRFPAKCPPDSAPTPCSPSSRCCIGLPCTFMFPF